MTTHKQIIVLLHTVDGPAAAATVATALSPWLECVSKFTRTVVSYSNIEFLTR